MLAARRVPRHFRLTKMPGQSFQILIHRRGMTEDERDINRNMGFDTSPFSVTCSVVLLPDDESA
jgi:hypothetical protein